MEVELYVHIVEYIKIDVLPDTFPSTKSNFIALAAKFELNSNDKLLRDGLIVARFDELEGKSYSHHRIAPMRNLEGAAYAFRYECQLGEDQVSILDLGRGEVGA